MIKAVINNGKHLREIPEMLVTRNCSRQIRFRPLRSRLVPVLILVTKHCAIVRLELLDTLIGQRMLRHLHDNLVGNRGDIGAG